MRPAPLKLKPKPKPKGAEGYQLVQGREDCAEDGPETTPLGQPPGYRPQPPGGLRSFNLRAVLITIISCLLVLVALNLAVNPGVFGFRPGPGPGPDCDCGCGCEPTPKVPQYFQTSPELWAGPTATGAPAFLAQTWTLNPTATYVPNQPLQTAVPIEGMSPKNESIFQMMGFLSPYTPSPGFGVQEYPLPPGADIVQVQMLSRHGSRYPTGGTGSNVVTFGQRVAAARSAGSGFRASGPLEFLNDWSYALGAEILVPKGRQELFDSGILHSYMYSSLYNPDSRIIVRTTTQDRMLKSAEYFVAGFFGLEWARNATIEVIIEEKGFNNSLAGYKNCPNAEQDHGGRNATVEWVQIYLQKATARLSSMIQGYDWTIEDTYAAQNMCPSPMASVVFCDLFTYDEWIHFSYSVGACLTSNCRSLTLRAVGIGYQQEVMARLRNHTLGYSGSQINTTLDSSTETFPLNQSLYLDFSHDTNIISVLAAMGLTQFQDDPPLSPKAYPGQHNFTVSHLTPFGARLDIEVIRAPKPVRADRTGYVEDEEGAGETKYVHFVLNQRTVPLGYSFPECDAARVDGWCELDTFLKVQDEMPKLANFEETCFGGADVGGVSG
ncbi:acid phosphatase [Diaporthe sp. PMI_573]|nr:acid phosphatase [Diaporthaceae sp. PMI_573]